LLDAFPSFSSKYFLSASLNSANNSSLLPISSVVP
jgi:hypothetical protein